MNKNMGMDDMYESQSIFPVFSSRRNAIGMANWMSLHTIDVFDKLLIVHVVKSSLSIKFEFLLIRNSS